jgi:hypothetical protein
MEGMNPYAVFLISNVITIRCVRFRLISSILAWILDSLQVNHFEEGEVNGYNF